MKRDDKTKGEIVAYVRERYATKTQVCQTFGIGRSTLNRWEREDAAFHAELSKAVRERLTGELSEKAIKGLKMLVSGYESRSEKTLYLRTADGSERMISRTVTKTKVAPDARAIIFVLANLEPENFEQ